MIVLPRHRRNRHFSRISLQVADDLGRERELASFSAGDVPDMSHGIARSSMAWLRSEAAALRLPRPWLALVLLVTAPPVVVLTTFLGHVYAMRRLQVAPIWMVSSLFASIAICMTFFMWLLPALQGKGLEKSAHLLADAVLRMGRCASCGYPLVPGEAEQDVVRCSECGAGWRRCRIGPVPAPSSDQQSAGMARATVFTSASCRTRRVDDRGRPYAREMTRHMRKPAELSRRLRRVACPVIPWIVAGPVLIIAFFVGSALLGSTVRSPWLVGISLVASAGGVVVMFLFLLRRAEAWMDRRRLHYRVCLACEERLHREGELLVCAGCGGAWRRPRRGRPRRRPGGRG